MTPSEHRIAEALQRTIDERLEAGLHTIEQEATSLMREVASEVWRSGAGDARPEQDRIVSLLSRDQAIRSLLASSDERFQALSVRSTRLEDHVAELAASGQKTRAAMEDSTSAIRSIAESPTLQGVEAVRDQLEQVEAHIAATFQHLEERDRALTEGVLRQVQEHGELIARETNRISEAMQGYVQGGTEAMGYLAQRVEQHAEAFAQLDTHLADSIGDNVGAAMAPLTERLDLMSERIGVGDPNVGQIRESIEALIEARMRSLGELIRSDSNALRERFEQRTAVTIDGEGTVDTAPLVASFEEHMRALTVATERQVQVVSRTAEEQVAALATATNAAMDRHVEEIRQQIEAQVARMDTSVGAMDGIDTMLAESQGVAEERLQEVQAEAERRLMEHVDDRMTAIARLIRSDNERLATALGDTSFGGPPAPSIDPELLRETLRTMKELQAGMATEVVGSMDTRFRAVSDQLHTETQSTAEAMIKVAEVLGEKIDRLTIRVDEGYGNDLQVVIERMGDAIRAMSGSGRRYDVG